MRHALRANACSRGLVSPVHGDLCLQLGQLADESGVHVDDVLPCLHGQPLTAGVGGRRGLCSDLTVWGQCGAWRARWAECCWVSLRVACIELPWLRLPAQAGGHACKSLHGLTLVGALRRCSGRGAGIADAWVWAEGRVQHAVEGWQCCRGLAGNKGYGGQQLGKR